MSLDVQPLCQVGFPHVGVDQEDSFPARHDKLPCQLDTRGRFPLPRDGAGDCDDFYFEDVDLVFEFCPQCLDLVRVDGILVSSPGDRRGTRISFRLFIQNGDDFFHPILPGISKMA